MRWKDRNLKSQFLKGIVVLGFKGFADWMLMYNCS